MLPCFELSPGTGLDVRYLMKSEKYQTFKESSLSAKAVLQEALTVEYTNLFIRELGCFHFTGEFLQ